MANNDNLLSFPTNPSFGTGIFRRRIQLTNVPAENGQTGGRVEAKLEDTNHAFTSTLYHDGLTVTDIETQSIRVPINTCGGAAEPIKQLIGLNLNTEQREVVKRVDPRANCTHLYDLTLLALQHATRDEPERIYDIDIPDEIDDPTTVTVQRNGKVVLSWQVQRWQLVTPDCFLGKPLFKGFTAWVTEELSGDELEAAFVLQKSYFVAQARRYDLEITAGDPALRDPSMLGVCYSYSSPVVEAAIRNKNTTRDFTNTPEQLLQFR